MYGEYNEDEDFSADELFNTDRVEFTEEINDAPIVHNDVSLFDLKLLVKTGKTIHNVESFTVDFPTLGLSPIKLISNVKKSVIFPTTLDEISKIGSIHINAIRSNGETGEGNVDVSSVIESLVNKVSASKDEKKGLPVIEEMEETVNISAQDKRTFGSIKFYIELSFLGNNVVMCAPQDEEPQEAEDQYDEYAASVNGYSMNIKLLRKKKEKPESFGDCYCDPKELKPKESRSLVRNGSQLIFSLPPNQAICDKTPPNNCKMYNVGTCPQSTEHGHGNEQVKVLKGNAEGSAENSGDVYSIKIGKNNASNGKGRLELELTAPKPIRPEDFKKKTKDAETQTEAPPKGKGKKGEKKK